MEAALSLQSMNCAHKLSPYRSAAVSKLVASHMQRKIADILAASLEDGCSAVFQAGFILISAQIESVQITSTIVDEL